MYQSLRQGPSLHLQNQSTKAALWKKKKKINIENHKKTRRKNVAACDFVKKETLTHALPWEFCPFVWSNVFSKTPPGNYSWTCFVFLIKAKLTHKWFLIFLFWQEVVTRRCSVNKLFFFVSWSWHFHGFLPLDEQLNFPKQWSFVTGP